MGVIIGLIIGLGITGLAIYTKWFNKRVTSGELVKAEVISATRAVKEVLGQQIPYVKLELCIYSRNGRVTRILEDQNYLEPGTLIDVWYDPKTGKFQKEELIDDNTNKGSTILLVAGIVWVAIMVGILWANSSNFASDMFARIMGYLIVLTFVGVGVWQGIVIPLRRKGDMGDCHIVTGKVTDYVEDRDSDNDKIYFPIYTYEKYGEPVSFQAQSGGNLKRYRQIGRRVKIVVNDRTGEVYASEDSNSVRNASLLFLLLGILLGAFLVYLDVTGQFGTNTVQFGQSSKNQVIDNQISNSQMSAGAISLTETEYQAEVEKYNLRYEDIELPENTAFLEYSFTPESKDGDKVYSYTIRIFEGGGQILLFPHVRQDGKILHQSIVFEMDNTAMEDFDTSMESKTELIKQVTKYQEQETELESATRYLYYYDGTERTEVGHSGGSIEDDLLFYYAEKCFRESVPTVVWAAASKEMDRYY